MGLRTFETGSARTEHCVTNRMLDDADIDVAAYLVQKVARKMQKGERRSYMTGNGKGKPDGILNTGNHVVFRSNITGSTPTGRFAWQDLVALYAKFPTQFRNGASWWFHEDAIVALMTMADADGKPIFSPQIIQGGGMPRIMGKEVFENTYMPAYIDGDEASQTFGQPIVGSKPIAFGNWKEGYVRINRKGFTVLRDPWSMVRCGVVWHFTRRFGGGAKCPNAMWFLEIR
jgi:HK97 family phage major capsid protein